MTVNRERVELWAQALESDSYRQCTDILRDQGVDGLHHCALGVGMAVAELHGVRVYPLEWELTKLPSQVVKWYGLNEPDPSLDDPQGLDPQFSVLDANDDRKLPFWDIAQLLRAKYLKDEE